jgi:hypothetical protein
MALTVKDTQTHPAGQTQELLQSEMYGWDGTQWVRLAVSAGGAITVTFDPTPGTVITTSANVAVGAGLTVPLPVIPINTRSMLVQNKGPAGTWVLIREVGSPAGTGVLMPRLGEQPYGGMDGSLAALEVEDVSLAVGGVAVPTTIVVQYQRD